LLRLVTDRSFHDDHFEIVLVLASIDDFVEMRSGCLEEGLVHAKAGGQKGLLGEREDTTEARGYDGGYRGVRGTGCHGIRWSARVSYIRANVAFSSAITHRHGEIVAKLTTVFALMG
jgi:hypothetical protein